MATSLPQAPIPEFNSLLVCALCDQELKIPRLLPCQHSFCTQCLQEKLATLLTCDQLQCPSCEKGVPMDVKDGESLPENFLFPILQERFGINTKNLQCISCNITDKKSPSSHKCLDCGDHLCNACKAWHCRTSSSQNHLVVAIEEMEQKHFREEWIKRKQRKCETHEKEVGFYCEKCECLICNECVVCEHKHHPLINWNENIQKHRENMKENIDRWDKIHDIHKLRVAKANSLPHETQKDYKRQENEIYKVATELHELIDQIKEKKLTELEEFYDKETKHRHNIIQQETNTEREVNATKAFAENFLEYSTDVDFLQYRKKVDERLSEYKKLDRKPHSVSFLAVKIEELEKVTEIIQKRLGEIMVCNGNVLLERKLVQPKEIFKVQTESRVDGLAVDDDGNILATSSSGPKILVLTKQGTHKNWIECKQIHQCWSIAVKGKDIFVTDINERKVIVMNAKGTVQRTLKLPDHELKFRTAICATIDNYDRILLSSTASNTIYIADVENDTFIPYITHEHEENIKSPLYLCTTTCNDIVFRNNHELIEVMAFALNKKLKWRYDGQDGKKLKSVTGLCSDKAGNVYIADLKNPRIHIVNNGEPVGYVELGENVTNVRPLAITKDDELIYGFEKNIVKISIWE